MIKQCRYTDTEDVSPSSLRDRSSALIFWRASSSSEQRARSLSRAAFMSLYCRGTGWIGGTEETWPWPCPWAWAWAAMAANRSSRRRPNRPWDTYKQVHKEKTYNTRSEVKSWISSLYSSSVATLTLCFLVGSGLNQFVITYDSGNCNDSLCIMWVICSCPEFNLTNKVIYRTFYFNSKAFLKYIFIQKNISSYQSLLSKD